MEEARFSAPSVVRDLTKIEGARIQILSAIDALAVGNIAAAVTLAGAAEGMLSDLATQSAFKGLRDHPQVPEDMREYWVSVLNMDRDWLKHLTPQLPNAVTIDTGDAAYMIVRALTKLPAECWTERMGAFKNWYLDWLPGNGRALKFPGIDDER